MIIRKACNLMVALIRDQRFGALRSQPDPMHLNHHRKLRDRVTCSSHGWFACRVPDAGLRIIGARLMNTAGSVQPHQMLDPVPNGPRPWAVDVRFTLPSVAPVNPDRPGAAHLGLIIDYTI